MFQDLGAACRCKKANRVYVAVSSASFEASCCWSITDDGFICKVGSTTNNCHDRWRDFNDVTDRRGYGYGNVKNWHILRCWEVEELEYDKAVFGPWMHGAPGIRQFPFENDVQSFLELYFVSHDFHPHDSIFTEARKIEQHKRNNEILVTASDAVRAHVNELQTKKS